MISGGIFNLVLFSKHSLVYHDWAIIISMHWSTSCCLRILMRSAHFFVNPNFFSELFIHIYSQTDSQNYAGRFKKFYFCNILHFLSMGLNRKKNKYLLGLSQIQKQSLMNIMLLLTEQLIHQCLFKSLRSYRMIPMLEPG